MGRRSLFMKTSRFCLDQNHITGYIGMSVAAVERYNHHMRPCALLAIVLSSAYAQTPDLGAITSRLSEEAEVFAHAARSVLSEETLHQRTRKPARRFRPSISEGTAQAAEGGCRT